MERIESSNVKQEKNKFNASFTIYCGNLKAEGKPKRSQIQSDTYMAGGLVTIQFRVDLNYVANNCQKSILLNFNKCYQEDTMEYVIKVSSPQLQITDKYISSNSVMGCPTLLYSHVSSDSKFYFNMYIEFDFKKAPKFSSLHDDKDLTDIELIGDDGSMALHQFVLACHSPVMKTMLIGEWKEKKERRMNAPGMSKQALEHLKNCLYLDDLPDTNTELEILLDFACRYMMTDLIQQCSTKLLFSITAENAVYYTEFAVKYKIKKMLFGIINYGGNLNLQRLVSSFGDGWM